MKRPLAKLALCFALTGIGYSQASQQQQQQQMQQMMQEAQNFSSYLESYGLKARPSYDVEISFENKCDGLVIYTSPYGAYYSVHFYGNGYLKNITELPLTVVDNSKHKSEASAGIVKEYLKDRFKEEIGADISNYGQISKVAFEAIEVIKKLKKDYGQRINNPASNEIKKLLKACK